MNQSKVRRDHDPWHDVAVPLNPEPAAPEGEGAAGSREVAPEHSHLCSGYQCKCCFEHEVCFHTFTSQKSDFVEISATASGLTACVARSGLSPGQPILVSTWNKKKIMHSIAQAWKTIEENEPRHVIIHPVVPKEWDNRATKAFWKFCADVARWQDGYHRFVTIMYPSHKGFWVTQGSRPLNWRSSFFSETFSFWNDPSCKSLLLKSNLPEGTFTRLHSLDRVTGERNGLDPRFVIVMTSCLQGRNVARTQGEGSSD